MATYTSAGTGLWSAGATWVGGVKPPSVAGHKVVIATGHVVTFDEASGTYGDDSSTGITVNGTLKASRSATTTLTCRGDLYIGVAGTLDYGTEADPIPAAYVATIIINDSAAMAANKWGIRTEESTGDWSGFRLWGASKTAMTTIPSGAASGDTTFAVADSTGWEVGDWLAFEPSVAQDSVSGTVYRAITGKSGNDITVGANLAYASQIGRRVFNLTRNVRVYGQTGQTYKTHISVRLRTTFAQANAIEIGPCELRTFGGHASNTHQFGGLNLNWASGSNTTAAVKKIDGPVIHDIWSISGSTVTSVVAGTSGICCFTNQYYNYEIRNLLITSRTNGSATQVQNGASVTFKDIMVVGSPRMAQCGYSQGCVGLVYDGGVATGLITEVIGSTGISIEIKNMVFDWVSRINGSGSSAYGSQKMSNCTFGSGNNKGIYNYQSALTYPLGVFVPLLADNCVFKEWPLAIVRATSNSQYAKPETYFQARNANNDPGEQRTWYRWGEKYRDASTVNRGTSSIRMDAWYSTLAASVSRSIAVAAGQTITVVGYLRFNTTFGTATPPSVTISGLGITPATFTAPATADTWHKFSLTVTNPQAYAGEFSLAVTGQSAANSTGAYCWVDGAPFTDYVTSVRHYGYVFDTNTYRTIDDSITEADESVVAAYATIDTLDKLHDRLNLWACENQSTAVFYDHAGDELTLGSYALVVDATAASAFAVVGSTITIKASTLGAGAKFAKVSTTGSITKANGAIISALYEDASGPSAKLVLHLPLASMAVCVHDGTGAEVECGARTGTYTLLIDPGATGTWKWAANKQGYVSATGSFTPGTGGLFELSPACPQVLTSDGNPMYQGTTSALVQVSFSGGFAYIDIGDGAPPLQAIYDACEDALYTDEGVDWIIDGGDGVSIFESSAGDFLFMTGGWRIRRWHAGDVNATVPAFCQSVDGTVVDGVNGSVTFQTSDNPTTIAAAVWSHLSRTLTGSALADVRYVNGVAVGGTGSDSDPWGPA